MATVNYVPKFGRVLIKRQIKEKIGSIYVPDAKRHASLEGIIVALGETAGWAQTYENGNLVPVQTLCVGDKVIFGRHSGAWLDSTSNAKGEENDDGSLFICQDADILCVVKEQPQAMEKAA